MPSSSIWYVPSPLGFSILRQCTQDGTLTDSIAAVEAAWGKVAKDIGLDPVTVIAATHGKRAIDNLAQFKPSIEGYAMASEVQGFEESILFFADAYTSHGPGSRRNSRAGPPVSSDTTTPTLSRGDSGASSMQPSRSASFSGEQGLSRPAFLQSVSTILGLGETFPELAIQDEVDITDEGKERFLHTLEAWKQEAAAVDRSVRILPGVKSMISSIPEGRYAVATSGAKTYGASPRSGSQYVFD